MYISDYENEKTRLAAWMVAYTFQPKRSATGCKQKLFDRSGRRGNKACRRRFKNEDESKLSKHVDSLPTQIFAKENEYRKHDKQY